MIKFQKVIKNVGPKGTYSINEQDGILHVVQSQVQRDRQNKDMEEEEP